MNIRYTENPVNLGRALSSRRKQEFSWSKPALLVEASQKCKRHAQVTEAINFHSEKHKETCTSTSCPPPSVLEVFLLGRYPPQQFYAWDSHHSRLMASYRQPTQKTPCLKSQHADGTSWSVSAMLVSQGGHLRASVGPHTIKMGGL